MPDVTATMSQWWPHNFSRRQCTSTFLYKGLCSFEHIISWQINLTWLLHSPVPTLVEFSPWGFMNEVLHISPVLWAAAVCHRDSKQGGPANSAVNIWHTGLSTGHLQGNHGSSYWTLVDKLEVLLYIPQVNEVNK